jgi:hypothetical protein
VTICLDDDVLDWFRDEVDQAGGGHDQTLIHIVNHRRLTPPQ